MLKVKSCESAKVGVAGTLGKQLKETREIRRMCLLKQLSSMRYLARQGLHIRGQGDDSNSNLIQLMLTRAEDISQLSQWIKNGKYLRHQFVNEL